MSEINNPVSLETPKTSTKGLISIIGASSVGTLIEWYDFYIFGVSKETGVFISDIIVVG